MVLICLGKNEYGMVWRGILQGHCFDSCTDLKSNHVIFHLNQFRFVFQVSNTVGEEQLLRIFHTCDRVLE